MAFSSIPAGATIYFDGNYGGSSPKITNDIPTENHVISVKQDAYYVENKNVDVSVGEQEKIIAHGSQGLLGGKL